MAIEPTRGHSPGAPAGRVRAAAFGAGLLAVLLFTAAGGRSAADDATTVENAYESSATFEPTGDLDVHVLAALRARGIEPAHRCSDGVFLRRVYVDLLGTLPEPTESIEFLQSEAPDRRAQLVESLLEREAFADYWALKWADLLRVKAEFPINLWPNGVQAYYRWIREAVRSNMPLDRLARELLTASGSNFRVAPVNFYRGVQDRSPAGLAAAVALTFMGSRFDAWPKERKDGMAAFFTHVRYKPTAEWKEEIVISDPAPRAAFSATFPDGTTATIAPTDDPRRVFADWLLQPDNRWFAPSLANRIWSWLFGRGIVHESDDLRDDNPPSNPALLTYLAGELVRGGHDFKHMLRVITASRTYQASPVPRSASPEARILCAHYPVRRLDAEVLIDALCRLDGVGETYVSIVPEPFTYLPNMRHSVRLSDGTITSAFLEMFGRPARDTGLERERDLEPTDGQRLYLLNSSEVQRRIERSGWLRSMLARHRGRNRRVVREIYTTLLARLPTSEEQGRALAYMGGRDRLDREAAVDLAWALINTKEFLYRH